MPVGIEEERIEAAVEIVVMRDVAARAAARIELLQPPPQVAQERDAASSSAALTDRRLLSEREFEEVGDRALLHHETAVHVGFAEA